MTQHPVVVVGHVGRGEEEAGQLPVLIGDQVQLEAEEPACRAFSPAGYPLKDPVGVYTKVIADSKVITDRQLLGVNVVVPGAGGEAAAALGQQEGVEAALAGKGEELGVGSSLRKEAP